MPEVSVVKIQCEDGTEEIHLQQHYTFLIWIKMIIRDVSSSIMILLMATVLILVFLSREGEALTTQKQGKKMSLLPAIEIETGEKPDAAVIWLHGLGADGNDFAPIIPELRLPDDLSVRFIFPHAPSIPVTINGGFVMPAWYDILDMEIDRKVDVTQLNMSAQAVNQFIARELERGIESSRIIVAGFSQGGAVAYQAALSHNEHLGGLLVMSTYFATAKTIELNGANKNIPIEVHHGLYDQVVPERLGDKAVRDLNKLGYAPVYKTYPMEHSVCAEQISDISAWLQTRLGQ